MKRFCIRSMLAMMVAAVPLVATAQEPAATDVLKPVDVVIASTTPVADPTEALESLASDVYALASGDLVTLRASLEPTSPSDSQNDPAQFTTTWVAQAAPARDAFEERVARLEAQVAALAAQLKSNSVPPSGATAAAPATTTVLGTHVAPRVAVARTAPAAAFYRTQVPGVTAPMATTPAARYSYSLARPAQAAAIAPATATTSAAPGAPIVIHIYVHGATGAPAAAAAAPAAPSAYFYSVPLTTAPAGVTGVAAPSAPMTTAPVRVRARSVPAMPAVPPVSANPTPGVLFVPATPATPAVPASPSVPSVPALPGVPGLPAGVPSAVPAAPATAPAGALTPTSTSQIAWDDVPTSEK